MNPYMHRRGDTFFFRIAVPPDLRASIGAREITKTLSTSNRRTATPRALLFAAQVKSLFIKLRGDMGTNDDGLRVGFEFEMDMNELGLSRYKIKAEPHELDAVSALAQTIIDSDAQARQKYPAQSLPGPARQSPPAITTQATAGTPTPTFHEVIDGFLKHHGEHGAVSMKEKIKSTMRMLRLFIADIPITTLKQKDFTEFFDMLCSIPFDWDIQTKSLRMTLRELAELDHPKGLAPGTFKTHKLGVRQLLEYASLYFKENFPQGITENKIKYTGDREKGEEKQRALTLPELKRMFEGAEMQSFAKDSTLAHQFWFPTIALFTGARVNEICQLNPQTDILKDPDTGINYFLITDEGDTDDNVIKSVKTGAALKVPMHCKLLELGILSYIERVKAKGHKRIFPEWQAYNGRAAGETQTWFRQFLRDTGLRDETPGAMITGPHCFRHTLLTTGANQESPIFLTCITGHEQKAPVSGAAVGYFGDSLFIPLDQKAELLNQLDYGLKFFTPVH